MLQLRTETMQRNNFPKIIDNLISGTTATTTTSTNTNTSTTITSSFNHKTIHDSCNNEQINVSCHDNNDKDDRIHDSGTASSLHFASNSVQTKLPSQQLKDDGYTIFPLFFGAETVSQLNQRLEFILRGHFDRGTKPDKTPRRIRAAMPTFVQQHVATTSRKYNISDGKNNGKDMNRNGYDEPAIEAKICATSEENNGDHTACDIQIEYISVASETNNDDTSETINNQDPGIMSSKSQIEQHKKQMKNVKHSKPYNYKKCKTKNHGIGPLGFSGNLENVKVMQVINVHKSDSYFRKVVTNPALGRLITELTGWKGVRLAQDQVWAKPPGAPPLVYHRDSPYFMFEPSDVITVWVALDNMDEELGPLTYVKKSHLWGNGRVGTSQDFFQHDGGRDLLYSAARREGIIDPDRTLELVSLAGLQAGGISIHDGRTWHGSKKNHSTCRPRRGLGIHFVPSNVRWTDEACKSILWKKYVNGVKKEDLSTLKLPDEDFPIIWER